MTNAEVSAWAPWVGAGVSASIHGVPLKEKIIAKESICISFDLRITCKSDKVLKVQIDVLAIVAQPKGYLACNSVARGQIGLTE